MLTNAERDPDQTTARNPDRQSRQGSCQVLNYASRSEWAQSCSMDEPRNHSPALARFRIETSRNGPIDPLSQSAYFLPPSEPPGRTGDLHAGSWPEKDVSFRRQDQGFASRFAKSRIAPGTPAGSCRKKDSGA